MFHIEWTLEITARYNNRRITELDLAFCKSCHPLGCCCLAVRPSQVCGSSCTSSTADWVCGSIACYEALLCSGLICLPQHLGNNNAVCCCVQTQSCYARFTFPENYKLQWTVYLLRLLLFMCLLIYLPIHPPKSNSQRETSQKLYKCFHAPVLILPGVIILALHKAPCQSL